VTKRGKGEKEPNHRRPSFCSPIAAAFAPVSNDDDADAKVPGSLRCTSPSPPHRGGKCSPHLAPDGLKTPQGSAAAHLQRTDGCPATERPLRSPGVARLVAAERTSPANSADASPTSVLSPATPARNGWYEQRPSKLYMA